MITVQIKKVCAFVLLLSLPWLSVRPLPAWERDPGRTVEVTEASPAWSLLFADDFEHGAVGWLLNGDWSLQADDGNQVLHGVGYAFAQADTAWDDYRLETQVRVPSGEAKIAIRVGGLNAGYYLGLAADGELSLDRWDGSDWTHLGGDPGPYPAGQWYALALEGDGSQLRVFVDGELAIQAGDASYSEGLPMLVAASGEADFDDVWLTGDAPAACPLVPSNGLAGPFGIAFNSQGELFVNAPVVRITAAGEIVPFGMAGAPGDLAIDGDGNLYVVAEEVKTIYKFTPDGARTAFVTTLQWPWFVAVGPDGYLYANDGPDIKRINLDDGLVSLWLAGYAGDMAFDAAGNLYVQADRTSYKITPDQQVSVIAMLPDIRPYRQYTGLAVDGAGNLYVGESQRQEASESNPPWVPPVLADKVYKVTPEGQVSTFASSLGGVWDMAFGPDGFLYVTEHDFNGISKIAPDGTVTSVVPCNGLVGAADVAYGPDGRLYFLSIDNYMVLRLEASGQQTVVVNGMNLYSGEARGPALAFNAAGDLFVAEAPAGSRPNRVSKITGGTATIFAPNLIGPSGLAFDGSGDLYISEGPAGTVARYSPDGTRHALADGLNQPQGLAYGPDELLYVAEYGGSRVSRISAGGIVMPFVTVTQPMDLAFWGNNLLVSSETGDLWQVDLSGMATRFATGPSNAGGIALAPDGSIVAAFGADNSIYRFVAGGTTPGVGITAPPSGLGQAGQVVAHTFTIQNSGNGRDGFWLTAQSEHGWPMVLVDGAWVGPLFCGQEHAVQVSVTIPSGTAPGMADILTLTARSRLAPGVQSSGQTMTVSSYRSYLPLVLKNVG